MSYDHYTSDEELGDDVGHIDSADASDRYRDSPSNRMDTCFDVQLEVLHYDFPGFTPLPSRSSVFGEIG